MSGRALDPGGDGGGASVRGLHVADVEVVVGKHGAADGADKDGIVLQPEVFDGFGDQLVDDAVPAARAVVRLVLAVRPCARRGRRRPAISNG